MTAPGSRAADTTLGDWIHRAIVADLHVEESGWAVERVRRAHARISRQLPAARALTPVVIWSRRATAFTSAGCYVYISRELLSRGLSEAGTAFVLAHEVAHHALGHVVDVERWVRALRVARVAVPAAVLVHNLGRVHRARADEIAADRLAFETCRDVGYPGTAGEEVFALLERVSLDFRAVDAVLGGPDHDGPHLPLRYRRDAVRRWQAEDKDAPCTFGQYVRRRSGKDP